jgi:hypothetical protein
MTTTSPSDPRATGLGPWPWIFAGFFVVLAASVLYFLVQPVPLARRLDPSRSSLEALPGDAVRVRVLVLDVPPGGQLVATHRQPERPGAPWRVDIAFTASPEAGDGGPAGERTVELTLPRTEAVDVYDLRGGSSPEVLPLRLAGGR